MNILEIKINQFIESIILSLQTRNWFSALALTLTMPDICGKLMYGTKGRSRYLDWAEEYFIDKYRSKILVDGKYHQHLTANGLYALRCAVLHAGDAEISEQEIIKEDVIKYIHFTGPEDGNVIHMNTIRDKLQIRVDIFCMDMIDSVSIWVESVKDNEEINERAKKLLSVHIGEHGFSY